MRLFVFFVLLCVFVVRAAFLRNKPMMMMMMIISNFDCSLGNERYRYMTDTMIPNTNTLTHETIPIPISRLTSRLKYAVDFC